MFTVNIDLLSQNWCPLITVELFGQPKPLNSEMCFCDSGNHSKFVFSVTLMSYVNYDAW